MAENLRREDFREECKRGWVDSMQMIVGLVQVPMLPVLTSRSSKLGIVYCYHLVTILPWLLLLDASLLHIMPRPIRFVRRYRLLVIATSMLLGVGLLVFGFLMLRKISEAEATSPNSKRRETSAAVMSPKAWQHIEAWQHIGAWQIMPAEDATSHGVELLNPTTYICACAKWLIH